MTKPSMPLNKAGFSVRSLLVDKNNRERNLITAILKIDAAAFWDVLSNNINMATLIENVAESRLGDVTNA